MSQAPETDSWPSIQHSLKELPLYRAICDSVEWKDAVESGLLFFILNSLLFLLIWGKYSIVTLISYLFLSFLVFCFGYVHLNNLNASKDNMPEPENPLAQRLGEYDFKIKTANVEPYLHASIRAINLAVFQLKPAFTCEHPILTAKVACVLLVTAMIGKCFSTAALLYIGILFLFIWPRLYHEKRVEITEAYIKARDKVHELSKMALEKMPDSVKKKLE